MIDAPLRILPVSTKADMEAFIALPYRLHQNDENWVPPLQVERRELLDPKKNPFMRRATVQLWIAQRGDKTVGRISAHIDPMVEKVRGAGEGHFGMVEAEDDPAVFHALFATAEKWLSDQGAVSSIGPFNLSINEEIGVLVDGRDTPPMLMMGHDLPYVADRIAEQGYDQVRDVYAYIWETGSAMPSTLQAYQKRPLPKGVVVRPINMKNYDEEVRILVDIFNDAWSENWGFIPLTDEEAEVMAKQLRPLIIPELVWFVEVEGSPAAFMVCLPNVNEAISDLNGKLLPFGWAKLLWRLKVKGLKSARVPLTGVRRKYLKNMLGPMLVGTLMHHLFREATARGMERVEVSWILEENTPMRRLAKKMGTRHYKTYRMFQKSLA